MLKIALLLSLGACAAGGLAIDREAAPHAKARLDLSASEPSWQITPSPVDPKLPSVDRLASRVRAELGSTTNTDLHVCVRPSGKVASVTLVGGSAMPDLDLAMVKDASAWQFASMPGPDTLQTCRTVTIAYHPHR
ncbi:MAG TPA: hypothetical protein VGO00_09895 [Kofleriaceae bacterium]|jgi:hypothetical protein|nr:hypothetical protein [Kofleriaceae bacterium]